MTCPYPRIQTFHHRGTRWLVLLSSMVLIAACCGSARAQALAPPGPSLKLVDKGSYLELPPDVFNDFTEATVEAWVKWNAFGNRYQRIFNYGEGGRDFGLTTVTGTNTLWFVIADPVEGMKIAKIENTLKAGEWTHVAGVAGSEGMKLYLNGVLVATNPYTGCFKSLGPGNPSRIGQTVTVKVDDTPFDGELAEVRVWKTARSEEQIRENFAKQLTGDEEGLAALWNFEEPANPGRDASPNHHDGELVGNARIGEASIGTGITVKGRPGGKDALVLDGETAGIGSNKEWFLDVNDNFTMEFWARPTEARGERGARTPKLSGHRFVLYPSQGTDELGGDPHAGAGVSFGTNGIAVVEHAAGYLPLVIDVQKPFTDWVHVAVVYRDKTPSLYLDGQLAGTGPRSRRTVHPSLWSAGSPWMTQRAFVGAVDDVRIWDVPLTEEQIRANLLTPLTGKEPGLLGWWNFDDPANLGRDASTKGRQVTVTAGTTSDAIGSAAMATVSGRLTDAAGKPVRGAELRFMQGDRAVSTVKSDENGKYFLLFSPNPAPYRVLASLESLEAESAETEFVEGSNNLDLTLRDTLRIAGTLSSPDGQARRGVKVEAVNTAGAVAKFSVSNAQGEFSLHRLPDGEYKLRAAGVELNEGNAFEVSAETPRTDLELTLPAEVAPEGPPLENRVLALDGSGAHVNLPAGMFGNLRETTIEAWVRFDKLERQRRFFSYGSFNNDLYLGVEPGSTNLTFGIVHPPNPDRGLWFDAIGVVEEGRWCHVALVIAARETRLYINGVLGNAQPKVSSFTDLPADSPAYIGRWNVSSAASRFDGGIDEVRVWAAARTGEEIRANMFQRLSGREEGLAGLWNFDDLGQPAKDATPNGFDGEMVQSAAVVSESLPAGVTEIAQWARLSGATLDVDGRALPRAKVIFDRGEEHLETEVDPGGNYSFLIRASGEEARLIATDGDLSSVPASLVVGEGPHTRDLTLRDAAPLSGHVRTPDGSPIPTVVIQAVPVVEDEQEMMIPGLQAEFFNQAKLTDFPVIDGAAEPTLSRTDRIVDFPLVQDGIAGANTGVKTPFFARWMGRIRIAKSGEYAFHLAANDAGRLFIDGRKVVELIWGFDTGRHAGEGL